ncbi:transcription initiation factor TFIID subunit 5 [Acrasis kona]|uniref:Transcription initiation factor TFIID subunit 5 n=1 Tax=Acrasis kona TaxID=1008807 RepID=A0AAW2ZQR0_9EUKA
MSKAGDDVGDSMNIDENNKQSVDNEESEDKKREREHQERQIQLIVAKYLQQRGFQKAYDEIQNELVNKGDLTLDEFTEEMKKREQVTTNDFELLNKSVSGSQMSTKKQYMQAYQALMNWVYTSLDIYKNEVIQVLYPVFVHCYLELVSKGYRDDAWKFLNKYKSHHTHFHFEEINTLQAIQSPELVAENELAKRFIENKFLIRLSEASFQLLMKFLQDSPESRLLLAIINRFVDFKVFRGQPSINAPAHVDGILSLESQKQQPKRSRPNENDSDADESDEDSEDESGFNKKKIHWEIRNVKNDANASSALASSSSSTLPNSSTSTSSSFTNPPGAQPPTSHVPGKRGRKKKTEVAEAQRQAREMREAAKLATPPPPSICLFTFFNSPDLTTISIRPPQDEARPIIAAGFENSTINTWNWTKVKREGDGTRRIHYDDNFDHGQSSDYDTLIGHSGPVYGLDFSSDRKWLLSCSADATALLWSVETGTPIVTYKGHQYAVWDCEFSPIDTMFATAGHDRTARLWLTDRISPVRILAGHLSDVETVRFHPNGNYVGTGSSDKTARIWDVQSGECVRMLIGHHNAVNVICFSPTGRLCASAEDDRILVWDLANGRIIQTLLGHDPNHRIHSVAFNHSGRLLCSASTDLDGESVEYRGGRWREDA